MVLKNNIYAHSFPNNVEKIFVVDTRDNPHGREKILFESYL